jgi:hypothetical protein
MIWPKSVQIFCARNALKLTGHVLPGATSAPLCLRGRPTQRRRAPRRSSDGRPLGLALLPRRPARSTARRNARIGRSTHGRVRRHVYATLRGEGTRGSGGMCEYVGFEAVHPPKSHEIAEMCRNIFCSDRSETRWAYAPRCDECSVVSAKPSDVMPARDLDVFAERAPSLRAPPYDDVRVHSVRGRRHSVWDQRGGVSPSPCSSARRRDAGERRDMQFCRVSVLETAEIA